MATNSIQYHQQMQDHYGRLWRKTQKNIFSAFTLQSTIFAKLNNYHREMVESLKPKKDDKVIGAN